MILIFFLLPSNIKANVQDLLLQDSFWITNSPRRYLSSKEVRQEKVSGSDSDTLAVYCLRNSLSLSLFSCKSRFSKRNVRIVSVRLDAPLEGRTLKVH